MEKEALILKRKALSEEHKNRIRVAVENMEQLDELVSVMVYEQKQDPKRVIDFLQSLGCLSEPDYKYLNDIFIEW